METLLGQLILASLLVLLFRGLAMAGQQRNASPDGPNRCLNPRLRIPCPSVLDFYCLNRAEFCDGERHCPLGEDEIPSNCKKVQCPFGFIKCPGGFQCLQRSRFCDGVVDCLRITPSVLLDDEDPEVCRGVSCHPGYEHKCQTEFGPNCRVVFQPCPELWPQPNATGPT